MKRQYQLDMLAKGLKPSEVLVANDTDNDAINDTAAVVDQDRKDNVGTKASEEERIVCRTVRPMAIQRERNACL